MLQTHDKPNNRGGAPTRLAARALAGSWSRRAAAEGWYWLGLPSRWSRQAIRDGRHILRVLDFLRLRPLPAGLVSLDHPWVTGRDPATRELIWKQNVIFATPCSPHLAGVPSDEAILAATGRFLARRVRQSAIIPELPLGPHRPLPHAINYMHGASHYNSGIILLNDLKEGFRHFTDADFRQEVERFVRAEQREVLILFRNRYYIPREYAYFSCCLRTLFPWFCNPNGPAGSILWGNYAPFPAANLITGAWSQDLDGLRQPGGARAVVRPAIEKDRYFTGLQAAAGRQTARWPERLLAWITYQRVRIRGKKGGMFFVDRRKLVDDKNSRHLPQARW